MLCLCVMCLTAKFSDSIAAVIQQKLISLKRKVNLLNICCHIRWFINLEAIRIFKTRFVAFLNSITCPFWKPCFKAPDRTHARIGDEPLYSLAQHETARPCNKRPLNVSVLLGHLITISSFSIVGV